MRETFRSAFSARPRDYVALFVTGGFIIALSSPQVHAAVAWLIGAAK